jgi:hypothetical protein
MSSVSNDVVRRKRIDDALARQNFAAPSPPRPPVNPATYSFVSLPPLPWIHEEEAKKDSKYNNSYFCHLTGRARSKTNLFRTLSMTASHMDRARASIASGRPLRVAILRNRSTNNPTPLLRRHSIAPASACLARISKFATARAHLSLG